MKSSANSGQKSRHGIHSIGLSDVLKIMNVSDQDQRTTSDEAIPSISLEPVDVFHTSLNEGCKVLIVGRLHLPMINPGIAR